jgi:hypothetical protein
MRRSLPFAAAALGSETKTFLVERVDVVVVDVLLRGLIGGGCIEALIGLPRGLIGGGCIEGNIMIDCGLGGGEARLF